MDRPKRRREGSVVGGKWRIEKRIARGGMGSVYAAVHVQTGTRVAIKLLSREANADEQARERFLKEGYYANAVDHEGVVRIIDNGISDDKRPFLVMELLEGQNLEQRRVEAGGKIPVTEALEITLAVADILSAAHDAALVHRDVKPANVFLAEGGTVKLLDFGVAGRREESSEHTRTGIGCGTPMFMAPEHMTGSSKIDARADVFALGTTLYRILTGQFPFPAHTIPEYLLALQRSPARLDEIDTELPKALSDVVAQAIHADPAERYQDAREFSCAITKAMRPSAPVQTAASEAVANVTVALATLPRANLVLEKLAKEGSGEHPHDKTEVMFTDRTPVPLGSAPPANPSSREIASGEISSPALGAVGTGPRPSYASWPSDPSISAPGRGPSTSDSTPRSIPRSQMPTYQTRRRFPVTPMLVIGLAIVSLLTFIGAISAMPSASGQPAAKTTSAVPRAR